jgi:AAA domain
LGGGSTATLLGAITSGKRKARLWASILSRATRSALLTVAWHLRRAEGTGMSDDLAARAAAEWRAERDRAKPLGAPTRNDDDYGVAERREGKQPQSRTRFALTRFADIKPLDSDEDYIVKGLLPRSGLAVVWGPPKCGKSFWTFDLLMHVALDWNYRGLRVRQGPVVYVCLEGARGFRKRVEAFRRGWFKDGAETPAPPFFLTTAPLSLVRDHKDLIDDIRRQVGNEIPVIVCIDTLNRSLEGSESKDEDMAAYIKAADAIRDAFDCLVVIVHHCGHNGERPRGHSALIGAADVQIAVRKDGENIIAELELAKDMEVGFQFVSLLERIEMGRDSDCDPVSSLIVRPADAPVATKKTERPRKLPRTAQIALCALHDAIRDLGAVPPASNHIPENVKTVSIDKWRDRAIAMGISTGEDRAQRKAFQSATEALVAERKAAIWQTDAWPI